jgi:hypothetical protein
VRFTIRPAANSNTGGGMSVTAMDAREALDAARKLTEEGSKDVEILDEKGRPYDLVELERLTAESENASNGE